MKKILNRSFCIILIFAIIFINLIKINVYADSNVYTNYLVLGDSIVYEANSYTNKIKENYNISNSNYKNLANTEMTSEKFYKKIQETSYTEAIKKADLITISVGADELFSIVTKVMADETGVEITDSNLNEKINEVLQNAGLIDKFLMLANMYNQVTSEEMKQKIETIISNYKANWEKSIKYIKNINPNATIVATEFYNPYYDVSLASYDLGGYVDTYVQKLNEVLTKTSENETLYRIAKIYEEFNSVDPVLTNVNIMSSASFSINPYPNALGQETIANNVIDILDKEAETLIKTANLKEEIKNNVEEEVEETQPEETTKKEETQPEEMTEETIKKEEIPVEETNEKKEEIADTEETKTEENTKVEDDTIAKTIIPNAGKNTVIALIVLCFLCMIVLYRKNNKYKFV